MRRLFAERQDIEVIKNGMNPKELATAKGRWKLLRQIVLLKHRRNTVLLARTLSHVNKVPENNDFGKGDGIDTLLGNMNSQNEESDIDVTKVIEMAIKAKRYQDALDEIEMDMFIWKKGTSFRPTHSRFSI